MYRREADHVAVPEGPETFTSESAFREGLGSVFSIGLLSIEKNKGTFYQYSRDSNEGNPLICLPIFRPTTVIQNGK